MNLFKLFKQEEKGKHMLKPVTADPKEQEATIIWNSFWGHYDYVMELSLLRQSVNIGVDRDHYDHIERMFVESLEDLAKASLKLAEDYYKNKAAKGAE